MAATHITKSRKPGALNEDDDDDDDSASIILCVPISQFKVILEARYLSNKLWRALKSSDRGS